MCNRSYYLEMRKQCLFQFNRIQLLFNEISSESIDLELALLQMQIKNFNFVVKYCGTKLI